MSHWPILPVLLPFVAALVLVLLVPAPLRLRRAISLAATAGSLIVAGFLLVAASAGAPMVYQLGNWPAPFGIVLVLDRLSALMLVLTGVVALGSVAYASAGADTGSPYFHPIFQFQLVGLHGAFLTGDLFNLFVFFEILLIASYCLLLYGGGSARLRAGLHYVVLNLAGSALFLIAVGTLYGLTGTLNMADLGARVARLPAADAGLVRAAGLLLLVVFALKAAIVPLHLWLPGAYAAASAPAAALFAIMTKVGVYAILRVTTLIFGAGDGVGAEFARQWLFPAALGTQVIGVVGALGSRELSRMVGYLLIASVGTMLAGIGLFTEPGVAAGLYYLPHSTVTAAVLFLLADAIARQRGASGGRLVPGPALLQPALIGGLFFVAMVASVGLPPLPGFIGKALILLAVPLADERAAWLWSAVLGGSLVALIASARAGSMLFWNTTRQEERRPATRWRTAAATPVLGLVVVLILLAVFAEPVAEFTSDTAAQLFRPADYLDAVLPVR